MPNQILISRGSTITFASSGGQATFTPTSVANGAGRASALYDRGAGALPWRYKWRARTKAAAALAIGTLLEIYKIESDGTYVDGNFGSTDAAWSAADKKNNIGPPIGLIVADSTVNGEYQHASGICTIWERYFEIAWWNGLGQSLSSTASDHFMIFTPLSDEVQ